MHDTDFLRECRQCMEQELIDRFGALTATHDQENRYIFRKSEEFSPALGIAAKDLRAHRRPDPNPLLRWKGREHLCCQAFQDPIGESRHDIAFVNYQWDAAQFRRDPDRQRHESALGENHIRSLALQNAERLPNARQKTKGIDEVLEIEVAPEFAGSNLLALV